MPLNNARLKTTAMKIEKVTHKNVNADGTFRDKPGAITTKGRIAMSQPRGGCELEGCNCSEGHWLSITLPINNANEVENVCVKFDSILEMHEFMSTCTATTTE